MTHPPDTDPSEPGGTSREKLSTRSPHAAHRLMKGTLRPGNSPARDYGRARGVSISRWWACAPMSGEGMVQREPNRGQGGGADDAR